MCTENGMAVLQKRLKEGERVVIDAGCVVAFSKEVNFDIKYAATLSFAFDEHTPMIEYSRVDPSRLLWFRYVGSVKRALFGGEGVFYAYLTGPGTVFIQSLPFSRVASQVTKYLRTRPGWFARLLCILFFFLLLQGKKSVLMDSMRAYLYLQQRILDENHHPYKYK